MKREELIKRFRKVAWGRLYWNRGNNALLQHMESDDVCIVRDGTLTTHYKTLAAFIDDLEQNEAGDRDVSDTFADDLHRKYYGTPRGEQ